MKGLKKFSMISLAMLFVASCAQDGTGEGEVSALTEGGVAAKECVNHVLNNSVNESALSQAGFTKSSASRYSVGSTTGILGVSGVELELGRQQSRSCRLELNHGGWDAQEITYKLLQLELLKNGYQRQRLSAGKTVFGSTKYDFFFVKGNQKLSVVGTKTSGRAEITVTEIQE